MAPFAIVALRIPSGPAVLAITTVACQRHSGFSRLTDLPAERLDQVRFLRGVVSHYHRDHQVEPELSVEGAGGPLGERMCLLCLPDDTAYGRTVDTDPPLGAIDLPHGVYDLHQNVVDRPYLYVERKFIDETMSVERAQRERWQAWLFPWSPPAIRDLLGSTASEPADVPAETFRTWLREQGRYEVVDLEGVPIIDFFRSVRRSNQVGNDVVAEAYGRVWTGNPLDDMAARFVGHLSRSECGGEEILDAGCGPAVHYPAFKALGLRWTGVDISSAMLDKARPIVGTAPGTSRLVQGDLGALPFRDGRFAGIWLRAVLVHVARLQLPGVLRECCRVVRDGGLIYLNFQLGRDVVLRPEGRIFFYHDEAEIIEMCRRSGLSVVDRWSGTANRGSLGDTRLKRWRHIVLRRTESAVLDVG